MSLGSIGPGCDLWFNGSWAACCEAHDLAYQHGTDFLGYLEANWNLGTCVWQHSPANAVVMVVGTTAVGWAVYKFKVLNGKTIYEIVTGQKYGP